MFRRTLALTLAGVVSIAPLGLAAEPSSVTVRIAKTDRRVVAFGSADANSVRVRLFKERSSGSVLLATKSRDVADDGSYRARFERPHRGTCRIVVRAPNGGRHEETFPCYIPDFGRGTATLTSVTSSVEIDALIADDDGERSYGLMYRPRMRQDLGMAFLYDHDTEGGFWMKNTLIPLSIAFFDSNGVILRIMDMEPCADDPCPSYDPEARYRGALEVNQGAFDEWGVSEGDRVEVADDGGSE